MGWTEARGQKQAGADVEMAGAMVKRGVHLAGL